MSIKKLNESIDNLLNEVEVSKVEIKPTFEEELRKSLKETLDYCIRNDRSLYSIADSFADRIESMVPDKRWWEITDCDFYTEMFNTGDFNSVINCIIDELKPEYKQNVNESYNPEPDEVTDFKKAVESADTIDDIQFLIYELSDGVAEEACQVAFDTTTNSDENDIDTIKDEVISAIDMYLEDNEFNESYQKGTTPKHKNVIESARDYGGAYDIDPSQYFTRDDINEFAEDVVDAINALSYSRVELVSTYLENNKIKVTVEWDGNEATASEKIDMRKIHKPNDIDKYSKPVADELIRQLKNFGFYVGSQSHNEGYLNGSYNHKNEEPVSKRLQEDDEETQYMVGDKEAGYIYHSYNDAKRAYDHLKSRGVDAVMEPVEDISLHEDTIKTKDDKWVNKGTEGTHGKFRTKKQADAQRKAMFANGFKEEVDNTLSEEYDEPELLGKGYAAPTSMDYVSNIKRLVKYKVTDFKDVQNLMQKTIDDIDAFDNYWKVHKAAIMKNIKEAQDLIPTEYRI
jgi:hypothetical protein